jgi:hypothetical protein
VIVQGWWPSVTSAEDVRAAYSPNNRRIARYILVRVGDLTTTKSSFLVLCLGSGSLRSKRNQSVPYLSIAFRRSEPSGSSRISSISWRRPGR